MYFANINVMSNRWCDDCNEFVGVEKTSQTPGIFLVIAMIIFFMPVIGTFIGIPALVIAFIWWVNTPVVCSRCGGKNVKKVKNEDGPSENEIIARKYEERIKSNDEKR